jgi:hypothetical protein
MVNLTLVLFVINKPIKHLKTKVTQKAAGFFAADPVKQFGEIPFYTPAKITRIGMVEQLLTEAF